MRTTRPENQPKPRAFQETELTCSPVVTINRSNRRTTHYCTSAADENYKIQALQPAFAPGRGITNASSDALPFTQTNGGAAKIKTESKNKK